MTFMIRKQFIENSYNKLKLNFAQFKIFIITLDIIKARYKRKPNSQQLSNEVRCCVEIKYFSSFQHLDNMITPPCLAITEQLSF